METVSKVGFVFLLLLSFSIPVNPAVGRAALIGDAAPNGPAGGPTASVQASPWHNERVDDIEVFADMGGRALAMDSAGRPHIAYGADSLYYAGFDGAAWHVEVADHTGGVGRFTSLALDAADRPCISYYDAIGGNLDLARWDGTAWLTETVDSAGNVGQWTSLALDTAGRPHISYLDATSGTLRYAYHDGAAWRIETVDGPLGDYGGKTSLALDSAGRPHISYIDSTASQVKYARYDGTAWQIMPVAGWSWSAALALDAADRPHISFAAAGLFYASFDGSVWEVEQVSNARCNDRATLVMDALDHPHIGCADWYLYYAYHDGASWHAESIALLEDGDAGVALALDTAGQPHIGYIWADTYGAVFSCTLRYAQFDGTTWLLSVVDSSTGPTGFSTSLALDSAGRPHIGYYDQAHSLIQYAHFDGADWHIEPVDTGSSPSLALDGLDHPHIAYASGGGIRYAYREDTTWITTTVVDGGYWGGFGSPSLALDSAGRPHISYSYAYKITTYVAYTYYDGTAWQGQGVDGRYGVDESSLALDAFDRPHISYGRDYDGLYYASYNGFSWTIEMVGSGDGAAGYYDTSLALDSAGRPHVSYGVGYPSYTLRYAHYDGTSWIIEIVDSAWYTSFHDLSLALDENDHPHIGYRYPSGSDLKYAFFDGAAWRSQVVDRRGSVGADTSLALDAAREPHISYHDSSNGDLKYAYHACAALGGANIQGPARLPLGISSLYTATYQPVTATYPLWEWNNGTLEPSASYSWTMTGTHTVVVTATNSCSQIQGTLTVTVFCQEVAGVNVSGPHALLVGQTGHYLATPLPITASRPLTFTWDNGTVGPTADYSWTLTGTHTLAASVANPCGGNSAAFSVSVLEAWPYSIYLPLILRDWNPWVTPSPTISPTPIPSSASTNSLPVTVLPAQRRATQVC